MESRKSDLRITPLRELPLSNNFMFGEVMRHPDISKLFLERLLQKEIAKVVYIGKEEDLSDGYLYHGIRLDVYLNDAEGTRYDIEMQRTNQAGLEKRIRYYQSGIDRSFLERHADYEELPESFVIFLCDFDYYKAGLACYERESTVKGCPQISYADGSHAIILNSRYRTANADPEIIEFLDYIRTQDDQLPTTGALVEKAKELVQLVRHDQTKEVPYMTWAMSLRDARKEGRLEGRQEGLQEGHLAGLQEGRQEGRLMGLQEGRQEGLQTGRRETLAESVRAVRNLLTPEEIASCFHLSLDTIRSILDNTPNT